MFESRIKLLGARSIWFVLLTCSTIMTCANSRVSNMINLESAPVGYDHKTYVSATKTMTFNLNSGNGYTISDDTFVYAESCADCRSAEKVVLSDPRILVGQYAFYKWTSLSTITGFNQDSVPKKAFAHTGFIGTFVIPEAVRTIKEGAFDTTNVEKYIMLGNIDTIEQWSFFTNRRLTTIYYFGTKDPTLQGDIFSSNTTQLKVSKSFIDEGRFRAKVQSVQNSTQVSNFEFEFLANGVNIRNTAQDPSELVKNTFNQAVANFGLNITEYYNLMTNFNIVAGRVHIGTRFCLNDNTYKFKIIRSTSTESVAFFNNAFQNFQPLQELHLSAGFDAFSKNSFDGCRNLAKVFITNLRNDVKIGNNCFANCPKLGYFQYCGSNKTIRGDDRENLFFGNQVLDNITILVPANFKRPTFGGQRYINNATTVVHSNARFTFRDNEVIVENLLESNQLTHQSFVDAKNQQTTCSCVKNISNIRFAGSTAFTFPQDGFRNKADIMSLTFENTGPITIGMWCFRECSKLTSLKLPETLTQLQERIFQQTGLTKVIIPASCRIIGDGCFDKSPGIVTVEIQGDLTNAGRWIFHNCNKLMNLTYCGKTVPQPMDGQTSLSFFTADSSLSYIDQVTVYVPNDYASSSFGDKNAVTKTSNLAVHKNAIYTFEKNEVIIEKVTTSEEIKDLFLYEASLRLLCQCNKNITHLRFTGNVSMTFAINGFKDKRYVKSLIFDNTGPVNIQNNCFRGCTGLVTLKLPDTLTELKERSFQQTSITSVVIPARCRIIGEGVFDSAPNITSVSILGDFEQSGRWVFHNCNKLVNLIYCGITVPRPITVSAGMSFFTGTASASRVTVHVRHDYGSNGFVDKTDNLTKDSTSIISGNNTKFTFTDAGVVVENIQARSDMFYSEFEVAVNQATLCNCTKDITNIRFVGSVDLTLAYEGFTYKTGIKSVTFENTGPVSIKGFCFRGCTGLTNLKLPETLTELQFRSFQETALTTVVIPASCRIINDGVFDKARNLTKVEILGNLTNAGRWVFNECRQITSLTYCGRIVPVPINVSLGMSFFTADVSYIDKVVVHVRHDYGSNEFVNKTTNITRDSNAVIRNNMKFSFADTEVVIESLSVATELRHQMLTEAAGQQTLCECTKNLNNLKFVGNTGLTLAYEGFHYKTNIKSVVFENTGPVSIKGYCFRGCSSLTNLKLPDTLTVLQFRCFQETGLTAVVVPVNCSIIEDGVFDKSRQIAKVEILGNLTNSGRWVFHNCNLITSLTYCGKTVPVPVNATFGMSFFTGNTNPGRVTVHVRYDYGSNTFVDKVNVTKDSNSVTHNNARYTFDETEVLIENLLATNEVSYQTLSEAAGLALCECAKTFPQIRFIGSVALITAQEGFKNKTEIRSVIFDNTGPVQIKSNCFRECTGLTNLKLPDTLTELRERCFQQTAITTLVIPINCSTINNGVFDGTTSLTSIKALGDIRSVGQWVFNNCERVTSFVYCGKTVPAPINPTDAMSFFTGTINSTRVSVRVRHDYASNNFVDKEEVTKNSDTAEIDNFYVRYDGYDMIVEAKQQTASVTKEIIATARLQNISCSCAASDVQKIIFRGNIVNVPDNGFRDDQSITSIEFQNAGNTTISNNAFFNCTNLVSVVLPSNLVRIGIGGLKYSGIRKIFIPPYCREIGDSCFDSCLNLADVHIGGDIDLLGNWVFHNCQAKLKNFTYCGTKPPMQSNTGRFIIFTYTDDNTRSYWGDIIVKVPLDYNGTAFAEHESPTKTNNKFTQDGFEFRYNGSSFVAKSVTATEVRWSVLNTAISRSEFCSCSLNMISSIIIEGNVNVPSEAFMNINIPVKSIEFQSTGVTTIGDRAFKGYASLSSIELAEGLTTIGANSFEESGLTNVEIPPKCVNIGAECFKSCSKLVKAHFVGNVTNMNAGTFVGCTKLTNVVYCGSQQPTTSGNLFDADRVNSINVSVSESYTGTFGEKANAALIKFRNVFTSGVFTLQFVEKKLVIQQSGAGALNIEVLNVINTENPCGCQVNELTDIIISGTGALEVAAQLLQRHANILTLDFQNTGNTTISGSAFRTCWQLKSINLPANLHMLGNSALKETGIETISIPSACSIIDTACFDSCYSLTSVRITSNLIIIENWIFHNCNKLKRLVYCGSTQPMTSDGTTPEIFTANGGVSIASNVTVRVTNSYTFTSFAEKTELFKAGDFAEDDDFTYIFKGESVEINGSGDLSYNRIQTAMNGGVCSSMSGTIKHVVVYGGNINITTGGFQGTQLVSFEFRNNGSTVINDHAFRTATFTRVVFNSGLKTIGDSAFKGAAMTSVRIPGCESLGPSAFAKDGSQAAAKSLRTVHVEGNIQTIRKWAFDGNNELATFVYCGSINPTNPDTGDIVFGGTPATKTIIVSEKYSPQTFLEITSITKKTNVQTSGNFNLRLDETFLTATLTNNGEISWATIENAFSYNNYPCSCGTDAIETLQFNGDANARLTVAANAFVNRTSFKYLHFKVQGSTTIMRNAFKECRNLMVVNFNFNITRIENWVFHNCLKLTTVFYCGSQVPAYADDPRIFSMEGGGNFSNQVDFFVVREYTPNAFAEKNDLTKGINFVSINNFITILKGNSVEIRGSGIVTSAQFNQSFVKCNCASDFTHASILFSGGDIVIANSLFHSDTTLKTIEFANTGETLIGERTFYDCTNLVNVKFNPNLTMLNNKCFRNIGITSVTIPPNCGVLMDGCFDTCRSLESVFIMGNVRELGNWVFHDCFKLTHVSYCGVTAPKVSPLSTGPKPDFSIFTITGSSASYKANVTLIVNDNYSGTKFAEVTRAEFLFEKNAFFYDGINYSFSGSNIAITMNAKEAISWAIITKAISLMKPCSGFSATIKSIVINCANLNIPADGFVNLSSIETIDIRNTGNVTFGARCFMNCFNLTRVSIADNVKSIGTSSFEKCYMLTELLNLSKLETVGSRAFASSGIQRIRLSKILTTIPNELFENCSRLERIEFQSSLTSIGENVFKNCSSINYVIYCGLREPTTNSSFGEQNIEVHVPLSYEKTTFLSKNVIKDASSLNSTDFDLILDGNTLNVSVKQNSLNWALIDAQLAKSLCDCSGSITKSVFIKGANVEISTNGFSNHSTIESIVFENTGTLILGNNCFSGCSLLAKVILPEFIKSIEVETFMGTSIVSIVIPRECKVIKNSAFADCFSLVNISIKGSITGMGNNIFHNCLKLKNVTYCGDLAPVNTSTGNFVIFTYDNDNKYFGDNVTVRVQYDYPTDRFAEKTTVIKDSNIVEYSNFRARFTERTLVLESLQTRGNVNSALVRQAYNHDLPCKCSVSEVEKVIITGNEIIVVEDAFRQDQSIVKLEFQNTGSSLVSYNAFFNCTNLVSVILPPMLTKLSIGGFKYSGITKIFVPLHCNVIENSCFDSCLNLTDVHIGGDIDSLGNWVFHNCNKKLKNFTYCGSKQPRPLNSGQFSIFTYSDRGEEASLTRTYWGDITVNVPLTYEGTTFAEHESPTKTNNKFTQDGFEFSYNGTALIANATNATTVTWEILNRAISVSAFCSCSIDLLASIIIEGNVSVPNEAFMNPNIPIKSLEFKSTGATTIGERAFKGYVALKRIVLADGLTAINANVFEGSGLTNVEIPPKCANVGANCFKSCIDLVKAHFVGNVTNLNTGTFIGCSKLTNVVYCGILQPAGNNLFDADRVNLINVSVSESYTGTFGEKANSALVKFTDVFTSGSFTFQFVEKRLVIQQSGNEVLSNDRLSVINTENPCGCQVSELTDIIISGTGTLEVESQVFQNHRNLQFIEFNNTGNTTISRSAFRNCGQLKSIVLPVNLISLGNSALKQTGIETINIPSMCTTIESACFDACLLLTSVRITSDLQIIDNWIFHNCYNLVRLVYCGKTQPMKADGTSADIFTADNGGSIAKNVTVRVTERYTFTSFAEKTELFKAGDFAEDDDFTYIFKGESVEINGSGELSYTRIQTAMNGGVCSSMSGTIKHVVVYGGNITITTQGFMNTQLVSFEFRNNGSTVINYGAFNKLQTFTSVLFNPGLLTIGGQAFKGTGLTSVRIPGCESIGEGSFAVDGSMPGDTSLRSVHIEGNVTTIERWAFDRNNELRKFVYCGSVIPTNPEPASSVFGRTPADMEVVVSELYSSTTFLELTNITKKTNIQTVGNFRIKLEKTYMTIDLTGTSEISWATIENAFSYNNYPCSCGTDAIETLQFNGDANARLTVAPNAFVNRTSFKYLHFKVQGSTTIMRNAFKECTNLMVVNFNFNITRIENWVFHNCLKLTTVFYCGSQVPAYADDPRIFSMEGGGNFSNQVDFFVVREYSSNAFAEKNDLTKGINFVSINNFITILKGNSVEIRGSGIVTSAQFNQSFVKCNCASDFTHASILFSGGDIVIANSLFHSDTTLKTIEFANTGETLIGERTFYDCTNLVNVKFNQNLTILNKKCFRNIGITSVTIPPNCGVLMDGCFDNCRSLESVFIMGNVRELGNWVFHDCFKLTHVSYCGVTAPKVCPLTEGPKTDFAIFTITGSVASYKANVTLIVNNDYTGTRFAEVQREEFFYELSRFTEDGIEYFIKNETLEINLIEKDSISWAIFEKSVSIWKPCSGMATAITRLKISGKTINIKTEGFKNIKQIVSVEFLNTGDMTVNYGAFYGCSNLTTIIFPPGLKELGEQAFKESGIQTITLPAFCNKINSSCFGNCNALNSVNIDGNIEFMGNYIFHNCLNLTMVTYCGSIVPVPLDPKSPQIFTYDAYYANGTHYNGNFMDNVTVVVTTSYGGTSFVGKVPLTFANSEATNDNFKFSFLGRNVKIEALGNSGFTWQFLRNALTNNLQCSCAENEIVSIKFLGTDLTIANNGLNGRSHLLTVIFENTGLTVIGQRAFSDCTKLQSVTLPPGLRVLNHSSFKNSGLTSIFIPENVSIIETSVFDGCTSMESAHIAGDVTILGNWIFHKCTKLTKLIYCGSAVPTPNATIFTLDNGGSYSKNVSVIVTNFYNSTSFAEKTDVQIYDSSFVESNFTFTIKADIITISSSVPRNPLRWSQIVSILGKEIPCGCTIDQLSTMILTGDGFVIPANGFSNESNKLRTIQFLNTGETEIKENAFSNCKNLTSITLPEKLVSIGNSAFNVTSLVMITIPASCKSVGNSVFADCPKLKFAHFKGDTTLGNLLFHNTMSIENVFYCGKVAVNGTDIFSYETTKNGSAINVDFSSSVSVRVTSEYPATSFGSKSDIIVADNYGYHENFMYMFVNNTVTISSSGTGSVSQATLNAAKSSGKLCDCNILDTHQLIFIGENVKIAESGFKGDALLESVEFNTSGEIIIGANAFENCGKLATVILPNGLLKIDSLAFANTIITEISIPNSCKSVLQHAFKDCGQLADARIFGNIETLGNSVFHNCNNLLRVTYCGSSVPRAVSGGTLEIFTSDSGSLAGKVTVQVTEDYSGESFAEKKELSIVRNSFESAGFRFKFSGSVLEVESITSTEVSWNTITQAFTQQLPCGCSMDKLTNIIIKGDVINIPTRGFADNQIIKNIEFQNKRSTILRLDAFKGCSNLESIILPEKLATIEQGAIRRTKISTIKIPPYCRTIGDSVFDNCKNLVSVQITGDLTNLGNWIFDTCFGLKEVVYCGRTDPRTTGGKIPEIFSFNYINADGQKVFGNFANNVSVKVTNEFSGKQFAEKKAIEIITSTVEQNGFVFRFVGDILECESKTSSQISWGIITTSLTTGLICGCKLDELTKIRFAGNNITVADDGFLAQHNLVSIEFTNTGTSVIGSRGFYNCSGLKEITLSNGLTSIGNQAFQITKLVFIIVPESCSSIGNSVFDSCFLLRQIQIKGNLTSLGNWVFHNCFNLTSVIYCGLSSGFNVNNLTLFTVNYVDAEGIRRTGNFNESVKVRVVTNYTGTDFAEEKVLIRADNYAQDSTFQYTFTNNRIEINGSGTLNYNKVTSAKQNNKLCDCAMPERHAHYTIYGTDINISRHGFENGQIIESLVFENTGLTFIEEKAFYLCSNLKSVILPSKLGKLGTRSFRETNITTIQIPSYCEVISDAALDTVRELTLVHITSDVKYMGNWVFENCFKLTKLIYCGRTQPKLQSSFMDSFNIFTIERSGGKSYSDNVTVQVTPDYVGSSFAEKKTLYIVDNSFEDGGLFFKFVKNSLEVETRTSSEISWNIISKAFDRGLPCGSSVHEMTSLIFLGNDISIPEYGFRDQQYIESIEFRNKGAATISSKAFFNCSRLASVILPDSIQRLESQTFQRSAIKTITIPVNCSFIGNSVFDTCSQLEDVHISGDVTRMGNWVFHNCLKLKKLVYCGSVAPTPESSDPLTIFTYDFYDQAGQHQNSNYQKNVTVYVSDRYSSSKFAEKESLRRVESTVSAQGFNFSFVGKDLEVTSVGGTSINWSIISSSLQAGVECGCAVDNINVIKFYGNDLNVPQLGFYRHKTITSIEFNNVGSSIFEYRAFGECSSLKSIKFPAKLKSIGYQCFIRCSNLTAAVIPCECSAIEDWAFDGANNLEFVHIKSNLNILGGYIFHNCYKLSKLVYCGSTVPANNTMINIFTSGGGKNFNESVKLMTTKSFPATQFAEKKELIKADNFAKDDFHEYTFYDKVVEVEQIKAADITYQKIIDAMNNAKICDCQVNILKDVGFTDIVFTGENISIANNGFINQNSLKSVIFRNTGKTVLGQTCFKSCVNLQTFVLPEGITNIPYQSLQGMAIEEINIPAQVTIIEDSAFANCLNLHTVHIKGSIEKFGNNIFHNDRKLLTLLYCGSTEPAKLNPSSPNFHIFTYDGTGGDAEFTVVVKVTEEYSGQTFAEVKRKDFQFIENSFENDGYSFKFVGNSLEIDLQSKTDITYDIINKSYVSSLECGCKIEDLKSLIFSGSDVNVPRKGFEGITTITSIHFNNTGEAHIEENAFNQCKNLDTIVLPKNLTYIQPSGFKQTGLKSIVIPDTCKFIGDSAFDTCSSLQSVHLSGDVNHLGNKVFHNCLKLSKFIYCGNVAPTRNSTDTSKFNIFSYDDIKAGKPVVESFKKNFSVQITPEYKGKQFAEHDGLQIVPSSAEVSGFTIRLPGKIIDVTPTSGTSITWNIIAEALTKMTCKCATEDLSTFVFNGNEVNIPNNGFENQQHVKIIRFMNRGSTKLEPAAFKGCTNLNTIELPEGLTKLDSECLSGTSLLSIAVPSKCEHIGDRAFANCNNLERVYMDSDVRTMGNFVFHNCKNLKDLAYCGTTEPTRQSATSDQFNIFTSDDGSIKDQVNVRVPTSYTANKFIDKESVVKDDSACQGRIPDPTQTKSPVPTQSRSPEPTQSPEVIITPSQEPVPVPTRSNDNETPEPTPTQSKDKETPAPTEVPAPVPDPTRSKDKETPPTTETPMPVPTKSNDNETPPPTKTQEPTKIVPTEKPPQSQTSNIDEDQGGDEGKKDSNAGMVTGIVFAILIIFAILIALFILFKRKIVNVLQKDDDESNGTITDSEMETTDYFSSTNEYGEVDDPLWGNTEENPVWRNDDLMNNDYNSEEFEEACYFT